jgi:hypothetical protein
MYSAHQLFPRRDCVVDSGRDLVRRANTMRHSRDSWRRDRTRAGGWVKAAFFASRSGRRFVRRALRRPPASATICECGRRVGRAMMTWASDLLSDLPADVLAQLLAGLLALVPAKIRYAQPHEWTGVTPESRPAILAGNVPAKVGSLPATVWLSARTDLNPSCSFSHESRTT